MVINSPTKASSPYDYQNPNEGKFVPQDAEYSRDNPLPGQRYFPEATRGLIQNKMGRDDAFYEGALNHGVGDSGIMTGGHSNDPMAQALENQYQARYNQNVEGIKTRNKEAAPMMTSDSQSKAVGEEAARYGNEVQNFNQQFQYQLQRQNMYNQWQAAKAKQKSSLLGSIFTGLGVVAGVGAGILTGGAAAPLIGAAVGGQLGGAAGKAASR